MQSRRLFIVALLVWLASSWCRTTLANGQSVLLQIAETRIDVANGNVPSGIWIRLPGRHYNLPLIEARQQLRHPEDRAAFDVVDAARSKSMDGWRKGVAGKAAESESLLDLMHRCVSAGGLLLRLKCPTPDGRLLLFDTQDKPLRLLMRQDEGNWKMDINALSKSYVQLICQTIATDQNDLKFGDQWQCLSVTVPDIPGPVEVYFRGWRCSFELPSLSIERYNLPTRPTQSVQHLSKAFELMSAHRYEEALAMYHERSKAHLRREIERLPPGDERDRSLWRYKVPQKITYVIEGTDFDLLFLDTSGSIPITVRWDDGEPLIELGVSRALFNWKPFSEAFDALRK